MNGPLFLVPAFALGALHALEPGHGKTVVAAYLVGTRGRVRDAVALGGIVTFTHTFSIILLGLATSVATAYLVPETVHEVLEAFSGLLIVGVGLWMVRDRILKRTASHGYSHGGEPGHPFAHDHREHPDHAGHDHPVAPAGGWQRLAHHHHHGQYAHSHAHVAGHHEGPAHEHAALALVGAGVSHAHGEVVHAHPLPQDETHHHHPELERGFAEGHASHDQAHGHPQGEAHGHTHDHALPQGGRASLGTLVTLGVSGGIVPCPAALALLLAAVGAGDVLGGVSLVVVFSLGLATVLIALGIAMVKAASLAGRHLSGDLTDRISRRAGAISAVVVTILGLAMTARALVDVTGARLF